MRYDYSADPLLNDRAKRMLGQVVVVTEPVDANGGRVRVGDSDWSARGGPAAPGERVRIVDVEGNCLKVEPEHAPSAGLTERTASSRMNACMRSSSTFSGTEPRARIASWKRRSSNLGPSVVSASFRKRQDRQLAELVGERLAGPADVAIDLRLDLVLGERGVAREIIDRLLARPALVMDAGVDDEPCRAPHLVALAPNSSYGVR